VNKIENIEELVAKVLSGEASAKEIAWLESWKTASSENLEYYRILEKVFLQSREVKKVQFFNTDAAWNKLQLEIKNRKPGATIRNINSVKPWNDFLRIAAMLLIVAGIGFSVYKMLQPEKIVPVEIAAGNQVKNFSLPDSTTIVLNRNSELAYTFTESKRSVALKGEAFFELAQDKNRPFEVIAGDVVITDIGTSFNVKASEGSDSLFVQVATGEVMMTSRNNLSVVLKKGEGAVYIYSRDEFIKAAVSDTNSLAYKTKIFVFENASLEAVVNKVNEVYGSEIVLSEEIKNCHITATFRNEEYSTIVDIIAGTLDLTIKKQGDILLLEGKSCEE